MRGSISTTPADDEQIADAFAPPTSWSRPSPTRSPKTCTHPDRVKLIANFGVVDNIDVLAAPPRHMVTNTPKVLTEDTTDMTMALTLAVPRRLIEGASILTEDKSWPGWSPTWMLGHRIGGKRLGIIGMGRIGQAVARRAHAFACRSCHNRRPVARRSRKNWARPIAGEP